MPRPSKYTSVLDKNRNTLNYSDRLIYDHLAKANWLNLQKNFIPYSSLSEEEKQVLREAPMSKLYDEIEEAVRPTREKIEARKKGPGRSVEW